MACQKESGNQFLLKMGCGYLKKNLRMENLMIWNHLKNQKLEKHFKTGLEIIILKSKGEFEGGGTWLRRVAMHARLETKNGS